MEYVILLFFCCNNVYANMPYCYMTYIFCLIVWLLLCYHCIFQRMLSARRNVRNDQVTEIQQEAVWLKALCSLCYKGRQSTVTDCVVCCWPWQWFVFRRAICPLWRVTGHSCCAGQLHSLEWGTLYLVKIADVSSAMPCNLIEVYQHFRGTSFLPSSV
jgi:hypothetical protein